MSTRHGKILDVQFNEKVVRCNSTTVKIDRKLLRIPQHVITRSQLAAKDARDPPIFKLQRTTQKKVTRRDRLHRFLHLVQLGRRHLAHCWLRLDQLCLVRNLPVVPRVGVTPAHAKGLVEVCNNVL